MFRGKARLSVPDHTWSLPSRNRLDQIDSVVFKSSMTDHSHLLVDLALSPVPVAKWVPTKTDGMPESRSSQSLNEHDSRDFDLAPNSPVGIPGGPLVPHLLHSRLMGKAKRPFPRPTHIRVTTLILNVLANDAAAETIAGTMAGLVGLDPDDRAHGGLAIGREPFLDKSEPTAFPIRHPPGPEDMEHHALLPVRTW